MKLQGATMALALGIAACAQPTPPSRAEAKAEVARPGMDAFAWTLRRDIDAMTDVERITLIGHSDDLASALVITCTSTGALSVSIFNDDLWPGSNDGYFVDTRLDKLDANLFQEWPGSRRFATLPDDHTGRFLSDLAAHQLLRVRVGSSSMVGQSKDATFSLAGFGKARAEHLAACRRIQPAGAAAGR
ncbi:MAG TPA: hypothetical protein VM619_14700 [Luteimonas sp.]|nr:hypothetical protein [Luteimonas sp.]